MPKYLMIEQFHLSVLVPRRLPPREGDAMRRALAGKQFRARLVRAIRVLFRRYESLRHATPDVSV
jgi:hypothetical protein